VYQSGINEDVENGTRYKNSVFLKGKNPNPKEMLFFYKSFPENPSSEFPNYSEE